MSDPNKVDPTNSQKLLKATSSASRALCCGVQSTVRLRKNGAAPSGLTTGNRPAKTSRKALEISFTIDLCHLMRQQKLYSQQNCKQLFLPGRFTNFASFANAQACWGQATSNRSANCLMAVRSGLPCSVRGIRSTGTTRSEAAAPKRSATA
jgi:hypothetical protein